MSTYRLEREAHRRLVAERDLYRKALEDIITNEGEFSVKIALETL